MNRWLRILLALVLVVALIPIQLQTARAFDLLTSTSGALYASTAGNYSWVEKQWYSPNGQQILRAHFKMQGRPYYSGASYTYDNGYLYIMTRGTGYWQYYGSWNWNLSRDFWADFAAQGMDVIAVKTALYTNYSSAGGAAWVDVPEVVLNAPPYTPGKPSLPYDSTIAYWQQKVTWNASGNPAGTVYELWRKTLDPSGNVIEDKAIYSGTATSFITTDQGPGKYYLYRVRAQYNGNWSSFSPETSYWTVSVPSVSANAGGLTISWPKVKDGLTYKVWWSPQGGNWSSAATTSLSYTISGLDPSVRYAVRVYPALSEGGTDWWAEGNMVAPLAYTPGSPTFSSIAQTSLQVNWSQGSNPAGVAYEVWAHPSSPFKGNGTFDLIREEHAGNPANSNGVVKYLGGGWNASTDYNAARIGAAKEGSNTFLRFTSDGTGKWAGATSTWSVKAGKWYRVTAKARTSSVTPINIADYAIYTGAFNPRISWPNLKAADGWKTAYAIFQADADRSGAMYLYGNQGIAGVTIDYDDVMVEEFDSQPPDAPGNVAEVVAAGGGVFARVFNSWSRYNSYGHPSDWGQLLAYFQFSNPPNVSNYASLTLPNVYWDAPISGLSDYFSVEHRGLLYAPVDGTYSFAVDSDDASALEIDGQNVVGWYGQHVVSNGWSHSGTIYLSRGWHLFVYRMEEGSGSQSARVAWKKPGDTSWSVIPRDAFGGSLLAGGPVTLNGLSSGTSYDVMVQAVNADGVPTSYSAGTALTVPATPATPSGSYGDLGWSNSAGRGWVRLTWDPVQGATGYKVWVFDGNSYRAFDAGNRTYWDSREEKIYPPESTLDSYGDNSVSWDLFKHDKSGFDLRDTPNKLYKKTVGTNYDNSNNYWFRVSAYNASGDSGYSGGAYMPTLPNRTDTVAPTGTVVINGDQTIAGGQSVTLDLSAADPAPANYTPETSDDASGVVSMRFSNDNSTWSNWVPYAQAYDWKLDANFGKKTVYAQFKDTAGNVSATASDDIYYYLVDAQEPQVTLTINGGTDVTSSPSLSLEISAKDDLTPAEQLKMRFSSDFSSWTGWEKYQRFKNWTASSGDGTKEVYVQVRDAAGNVGLGYGRINLVSTAGTVQVSNGVFWSDSGAAGTVYASGIPVGARFVTSPEVTVKLNTPGVSSVQYSLDNVRWLAPEPVTPQKVMSLPDWDGIKTVYAKLSNGVTYAVRIVLDRTPPVVSASWLGGATITNAGSATILLIASDNLSRAQDLQYSTDGGTTWRPYAQQIPVTFSGAGYKTVTLQVRDQAGNVTSVTLGIFN